MPIDTAPVGYESVVVGATAVGLTAAQISSITPHGQAYITLEGGSVRYRMDGTDPTAAEGHLMHEGDTLTLEGRAALDGFAAIQADAAPGTLRVTYLQA